MNAQSSIIINAPADKVWEALTRPDLIKQWFFGVDTETDWRVGGPIVHRGVWQGKPYADKGKILRFEPPYVLAHSHWSDLSGLPDREENYQQVTYTITERDGASELTISEVNIPTQEAQAISERSWAMVLGNLKDVVEK